MSTNVSPPQQYSPGTTSPQPSGFGSTQHTPPESGAAGQQPAGFDSLRGLSHLPPHARQLQPPRAPLYRPSVLRPTERPARPYPPTPPDSSNASLDSLNAAEARAMPRLFTTQSAGTPLTRVAEDDWLLSEGQGQATGPPTKQHWKRDEECTTCHDPTCMKSFNLFERRHHCRRCGWVFCNEHTPYTVPLDQHAQFHTNGLYNRACNECWNQYKRWEVLRQTRKNSSGTDSSSQSAYQIPSTPTMGINSPGGLRTPTAGGPNDSPNDQRVGSVAGSVPRDWNWSTF
ncbi:MAG: hypothetical protein M1824_002224 [Vezdaea acicularis]|nr:MAG: hypothetical protein M1824_002224 [Vezdaea acicularis]